VTFRTGIRNNPTQAATSDWPHARSEAVLRELIGARPDLRGALAAILRPLAEYDRRHTTELVPTLGAFFAAEGSSLAAAKALGLHRHTVDYRIKRIEQVLGRSVRTGADRLVVHLAVIAARGNHTSS
jgi:DNA-binding PucR family transcriptional regulator